MTTDDITRADAVLSRVGKYWRTTAFIDGKLYEAGFKWTMQTTRDTLTALAEAGKVERQKAGSSFRWRLARTPESEAEPEAPTAEARDALAILDELRATIEQAQQTPAAASPAEGLYVPDEADLADLLHADDQLVTRIVKRASYDALRMMLLVLDGWIEGARENNEALGRREDDPEQFHADDIRRMVNDAARMAGTREPYRKDDADA